MSDTPSASGKPAGGTKPPKVLRRVLLVEDDGLLAMALEDALLRAGAGEVVICATMQQTMRELERNLLPDSVILDVHLADRDDGWALAELVTVLGPKAPRIAFSTGSPESIPPKVAALGPVFEKPYNPDELVAALLDEKKPGLFTRLRLPGR